MQPIAGWNFKTGQFVGSLSAAAAWNGLVLTSEGATINTGTTVTGTAALIAKVPSAHAWVAKLAGRAGAANGAIVSEGNSFAPLFIVAGGTLRSYHGFTPEIVDNPNRRLNGPPRYVGFSQGAGGMTNAMNGNTVITGGISHGSPASIQLGLFNGGSPLNDDIEWLFLYPELTAAQLRAVTQEPARPFKAGQAYLRGMDGNYVDFGVNVPKLTLEWNQPWSCLAAVRLCGKPNSGASDPYLGDMIFTNVSDSGSPGNYRGFELWLNSSGQLHVRIISNISGGTPRFIGVIGTVDRTNGSNIVLVGASYDGSGTAAGVKIYFAGVAETTTVESDTLAGSTIIDGSQHFLLLNQYNKLGYKFLGDMGFFCFTNDVKDAAWFAAHADMDHLPANDNTMLLYPDIANMAAGTTVNDLSQNPANGTTTIADVRMAA